MPSFPPTPEDVQTAYSQNIQKTQSLRVDTFSPNSETSPNTFTKHPKTQSTPVLNKLHHRRINSEPVSHEHEYTKGFTNYKQPITPIVASGQATPTSASPIRYPEVPSKTPPPNSWFARNSVLIKRLILFAIWIVAFIITFFTILIISSDTRTIRSQLSKYRNALSSSSASSSSIFGKYHDGALAIPQLISQNKELIRSFSHKLQSIINEYEEMENTDGATIFTEKQKNYPVNYGCYIDKTKDRDLPAYIPMFFTTPKLCQSRCYYSGYKIAGVQNGNECWCSKNEDGKKFGKHGKAKSEKECTSRCKGNPRFFCGGPLRNEIYDSAPIDQLSGSILKNPRISDEEILDSAIYCHEDSKNIFHSFGEIIDGVILEPVLLWKQTESLDLFDFFNFDYLPLFETLQEIDSSPSIFTDSSYLISGLSKEFKKLISKGNIHFNPETRILFLDRQMEVDEKTFLYAYASFFAPAHWDDLIWEAAGIIPLDPDANARQKRSSLERKVFTVKLNTVYLNSRKSSVVPTTIPLLIKYISVHVNSEMVNKLALEIATTQDENIKEKVVSAKRSLLARQSLNVEINESDQCKNLGFYPFVVILTGAKEKKIINAAQLVRFL
ncbi:Cytosolic Fe-S cluster assembly factor nubp1 [Nowakowskiella sp. JEL0407]|nr:Cytosolic Fe-S cluster assembly factor nubp1 [Nowakowskiella sp. JEL0407]